MKNIGMEPEKVYQNTVNCIEFPQIPEGACHTLPPSPPSTTLYCYAKDNFFWDKMRKNLFI